MFSCKFAAYFQNTFSQEHLWTADSTNCSKIKLVIYQSTFCWFFFWGNGWLFKRSILISLFVIDFKKVLKHFLNLNTDKSVSTGLIKNGSILHFNHLYGFRSSSLLSQLELFKVLVFGKVCFNLIKLSLFCFIYFFFILLFFISFRFFISIFFLPVSGQLPQKKIAPPVGVRVWVSFRVRARIEGKFLPGAIVLEPFLPVEKRGIFCVPTKC